MQGRVERTRDAWRAPETKEATLVGVLFECKYSAAEIYQRVLQLLCFHGAKCFFYISASHHWKVYGFSPDLNAQFVYY
jgi:hypothetical protein